MKKSKDSKAWLLGMKKFLGLHDYSKNMKVKITIFSLKGKVDIWWKYVKRVGYSRARQLVYCYISLCTDNYVFMVV